jgi:hypothetical protein
MVVKRSSALTGWFPSRWRHPFRAPVVMYQS